MRVDLMVPFTEKDLAKAAGARWDPARKVWYAENLVDLAPLLRWMPERLQQAHAPRRSKPKTTPLRNELLPTCECAAPPWEHCEHTRGASA